MNRAIYRRTLRVVSNPESATPAVIESTDRGTSPKRSSSRTVPAWAWFVAWSVVGAGSTIVILGALSIGPLVLPPVIAGTVLLATRRNSDQGLPGILSGFSAPLFYVAYLNRDGPGTICKVIASEGSCTERGNPWRWFAVASILLLAGVAVFALAQRRQHASQT